MRDLCLGNLFGGVLAIRHLNILFVHSKLSQYIIIDIIFIVSVIYF